MRVRVHGIAACLGALLAAAVSAQSAAPEETGSRALIARPEKPLALWLTQAQIRSVIRNYEMATGEILTDPIDEDEVLVTAPGELAPMRDVTQDAWGGVAAPFWAIMNPKNAWRIFLPIPPKDDRK